MKVEPPHRQSCIIVTLNDPVLGDLARVVGRPLMGKPRGRILWLASRHCGISKENLHIGGPPVDNVAIDEEGSITLLKLVSLSMFIGIGLAYACFRSVRATMMLFFVGGVAAISSLAFVWFADSTLDAILMSMPSLVYVLGLSAAVHIVNYYRDAARETGEETAVDKAIKHGWFPCTLAAFTTSLGLVSLYTSYLTPIKKFGLYSSIATMATVILLFSYLPAALYIWPAHARRKMRGGKDQVPGESRLSVAVGNFWSGVGEWVIRRYRLVISVSVVMLCIFAYGITQVKTSVHLLKLFDPNAKILSDYRWMEKNLGKLVPMEVVLQIDEDAQQQLHPGEYETDQNGDKVAVERPKSAVVDHEQELRLSMLERAELSQRVRIALEEVFGPGGLDIVGAGTSTDVFMPLFHVSDQVAGFLRDDTNSSLTRQRDMIAKETDYFRIDPSDGKEYWRISLRLEALNDVDYGQFVGNLKTVVEPILTAYRLRTRLLRDLHQLTAEKQKQSANDPKADALRIILIARDPRQAESFVDMSPEHGDFGKVDQSLLFSNTIRDLLENRGFKEIKSRTNLPKRGYLWVTPERYQKMAPENRRKNIEQFDAVVLLENHPDVSRESLAQETSHLYDLTDHDFILDQRTNEPATGMMTAWERAKASKSDRDGDNDVIVSASYTGIVPIVYKAQRSLLHSLINSICLAFGMIAIVMMVLLRNWGQRVSAGNLLNFRGGMVSMLPNVFPVVIVFGAMGLSGILVDIGSMMTASVAMGVAVDDTIHFLNWYRASLKNGNSRLDSIRISYRKVATAMTQTTLIGGFGLAAFAFSTFTPTQRFGVLMLFLLAAALVGDLIFLPAILASPLGKLFGKPRTPSDDDGANAASITDARDDVTGETNVESMAPASNTDEVESDAPIVRSDAPQEVEANNHFGRRDRTGKSKMRRRLSEG